jgi:hypothetical protein
VIGLSLGVERQQYFGFPNFSSLFAAGETGVIFDPSTTGALYTTTAMILPALPGDPVGMMLDQSQWGGAALGSLYGDELVTNGTFDTDTTGWSGARANETISLVGGGLQSAAISTGAYGPVQGLGVLPVGSYLVTANVVKGANNSSTFFRLLSSADLSTGSTLNLDTGALAGTVSVSELVTITTEANYYIGQIAVSTLAGSTLSIDNVSVREITVANALAPIVGPELVTNGGFDGNADNWTLGGTSVYNSNAVDINVPSATGALSQTTGATVAAGRTYLVTYTITNYSGSGSIRPTFGSAGTTFSSGNGTFSVPIVAASTNSDLLFINGGVAYTATIDNISVKEIPGYHATQATASKRPIYGIHPFGGRRNLLTYSENFSNAAWTNFATGSLTLAAGAAVGPDGLSSLTRFEITDATNEIHLMSAGSIAATTNATYCTSVYFRDDDQRYVGVRNYRSSDDWSAIAVDLETGTVTQSSTGSASGTVVNSGVENLGGGLYRVFLASNEAGPTLSAAVDLLSNGTPTRTAATGDEAYIGVAGVSVFAGAVQLEAGATATDYQKVTSQYVVTETGVPSVHYLRFDGVDDAMVTPSINFTATDEMSVFAGVRKLSDATANIAELSTSSTTTSGTFFLYSGAASGQNYAYGSRGTQPRVDVLSGTITAPSTNVLSGISDISGDLTTLRVGGTEVATSAVDQGPGNYGNFPLYIGARATTSLYFNGHLYGLTVRGALTEPPTLSRAENLMAQKTGIEL